MASLTDAAAAAPTRAGRLRAVLTRIAREPLVHFLLFGALLFGVVSLVRSLERPTVVVDAQDLNQIVQYWQLQAQRAPTPAELKSILQERVDEELMAREAQRLGMDRGDLIIRRRLAQKMEFASEDTSAAAEPTPDELQRYFDAHRARYAAPARAALQHVFFSRDRGAGAKGAALQALAKERAGEAAAGDPSLLPLSYADVRLDDLARDYGPAFATAAAQAPLGVWQGPIESPFGFHLLRVESRSAHEVPKLADVRAQVRDDLLADRRRSAAEAFLAKLRRKYRVQVAGLTS